MAFYGVPANKTSPEVLDELYRLLCAGLTMSDATRRVGLCRETGTDWWRKAGGMRLKGGYRGGGLADPPTSDGSPGSGRLSKEERVIIQSGLRHGRSYGQIAAETGRDKSVIWREAQRNRNPDGLYHADLAHARAHGRAHRPKAFKLVENRPLCEKIEKWMDQGWSPKLISLVLARDFAHDQSMQVSHETIYQCLYVQARGQLRQDLYQRLSLKRARRVPHKKDRTDARGKLYRNALKISERPPEVEDRAIPGHWEGDLIIGTGSRSAIGTLVERTTRFTVLLHLPDRHTAEAVSEAMIKAMSHLPDHLRRTITWDRGSELAEYEKVRLELGSPVYFCDPHSPWQRGTNENTNRLLRHWFEKYSDLSGYTAADLRNAQDMLNRRPRPTLGLETPADRLKELLQTAA